eukprot:TRINITY_DN11224_c0_g2_i15.p3 TRINITY_DN11224_c0_g2~~TRINITY_DN11224_c0_g2_i15.p3  ORF type:complete len:117 (-),score=40.10 TRINITY_DN11224_c0_g2_i15:473-823(-)
MHSVGYTPNRQQVKEMIGKLDTAKKGYVTLEEFSEVLKPREIKGDVRNEATTAFAKMNADKSGKISFGDLKRVLMELGENLSDEQIKAMIQVADKDNDGQVSYAEFMDMMYQAKQM